MTNNNDGADWLNAIAEKYDPDYKAESERQAVNSVISHLGGDPTNASTTEPWNIGKPAERSGSPVVLAVLIVIMVVLMGVAAVLLFTMVQ